MDAAVGAPVCAWGEAFPADKEPAHVGGINKAATGGDLFEGQQRVAQIRRGLRQAAVLNALSEALATMFAHEPGEIVDVIANRVGDILGGNGTVEMSIDPCLGLSDHCGCMIGFISLWMACARLGKHERDEQIIAQRVGIAGFLITQETMEETFEAGRVAWRGGLGDVEDMLCFCGSIGLKMDPIERKVCCVLLCAMVMFSSEEEKGLPCVDSESMLALGNMKNAAADQDQFMGINDAIGMNAHARGNKESGI